MCHRLHCAHIISRHAATTVPGRRAGSEGKQSRSLALPHISQTMQRCSGSACTSQACSQQPAVGMPLAAAPLGWNRQASRTRLGAPGPRGTSSISSRRAALHIAGSITRKAEDVLSVSKLPKPAPRDSLRMGLPSKGRMAEDTIQLLKDCQLSVYKPNPRQYVANVPQIPGLEVWFQRATDVVRKLRLGDIDLGIVGLDMFSELGDGDEDLIVVHEALNFGHCHLALGVPSTGKFADVRTLQDLKEMGCWTAENPLRVVTGYHAIALRFFAEQGFEHVALLTADGALEAAPAMGCADIILDLVSTGVTLKENNLREIEGGHIMDSEGVLVANRRSLLERPGLLPIVHELVERFDAHLKAEKFYSVVANMRGESPEAVAQLLLECEGLQGLQGPTISPVYTMNGGVSASQHGFYACVICVPKKRLYASVKTLQRLGGSGVLVQPMTYIFDEEPERWHRLLKDLDIDEATALGNGAQHNGRSNNGAH